MRTISSSFTVRGDPMRGRASAGSPSIGGKVDSNKLRSNSRAMRCDRHAVTVTAVPRTS